MNALKSLLMPLVLPKIKVSATSLARKTVLILGFGGSKVRNYKRLERYYAAMDVNTITFVMPLLTPKFLRVMYMDEVLRNVKDVVLDSSGDDNGLLVHSFSNNGIWAYGEYCVQVQMSADLDKRKVTPRKIIVDSAPHLFDFSNPPISDEVYAYTRVLTSIILAKPVYDHNLISPVVKVVLYLAIGFSRLCWSLFPQWSRLFLTDLNLLGLNLRDKSPRIPSLFIYSKGDNLMPYESVDAYMSAMKYQYALEEGAEAANKIESWFIEEPASCGHVGAFYHEETVDKYKQYIRTFLLEVEDETRK
jgi:hypothetical protein